MVPSARQWGPPELLATLPPMVHAACDEGSGAKCSPWGSVWRERSRLITPGPTHAVRLAGSTSKMRSILVSTTTSAGCAGTAPPASPVPAPRATTGMPWWPAAFTSAATSSVDSGKATTAASPRLTPPSDPKR